MSELEIVGLWDEKKTQMRWWLKSGSQWLDDSNSKKGVRSGSVGRFSDSQIVKLVIGKEERREKRERGDFLAMVLERELGERVSISYL